MSPTNLSPLANHLWQSTLCVGAAWLLALALKKNRPGVRYWLWLTASVKFLVPFSLLVSVGAHVWWRPVSPATLPEFSDVLNEIGRPFGPAVGVPSLAITPTGVINLPTILIAVWLCGIAVGLIFWLCWFRHICAVTRTATPLALNLPIPVLSSPARLEPGVFGIRRPALILPAGITDRLTPGQLEAVLGHELCHVRRMDNLTGAIHMLVNQSSGSILSSGGFVPNSYWRESALAMKKSSGNSAIHWPTLRPYSTFASYTQSCHWYVCPG